MIQLEINFGCMTIEQATKRDLVVANGIILKIILTNTTIGFVGMINKKKLLFSKIVGLLEDIRLF